MGELAEWLGQQLDEDERAARRMEEHFPSPWELSDRGWMAHAVADGPAFREVVRLEQWHGMPEDVGLGQLIEHVARHDPARVLREVDAKRQILGLHTPFRVDGDPGPGCNTCSWRDDMEDLQVIWPCSTLRLLALPYAGRPGYRDEWRP